MQIPTNHVVRGDIVVLGTGDVVPADPALAGRCFTVLQGALSRQMLCMTEDSWLISVWAVGRVLNRPEARSLYETVIPAVVA